MIVRELLVQAQTTFGDAGAWLVNLSCKFGLAPSCVYTDWKDLTVGQATLVAFLAFAIVRLILDKWAIRKFIAFCLALIAWLTIVIGETYLVDHLPFKVPESLPRLPINLLGLLAFILIPFFVASLVHRFALNRLSTAPK
jgi:hypothetical protein